MRACPSRQLQVLSYLQLFAIGRASGLVHQHVESEVVEMDVDNEEKEEQKDEEEEEEDEDEVDVAVDAEQDAEEFEEEEEKEIPDFEVEEFENDNALPGVDDSNLASVVETLVLQLLEHRSVNRGTNKGITDFLRILQQDGISHPKLQGKLPSSYEQAERMVRNLLSVYHKIPVCKNECVLFQSDLTDATHCPKCGEASRDESGRPWMVFRYFPLKSRLQRLFGNKVSSILFLDAVVDYDSVLGSRQAATLYI